MKQTSVIQFPTIAYVWSCNEFFLVSIFTFFCNRIQKQMILHLKALKQSIQIQERYWAWQLKKHHSHSNSSGAFHSKNFPISKLLSNNFYLSYTTLFYLKWRRNGKLLKFEVRKKCLTYVDLGTVHAPLATAVTIQKLIF